MRRRRAAIATLAVLFALCIPVLVLARPASTDVPISDRAYRDIEKLVSWKLVRPPMIDQRPLSRGEFARIVAQARDAIVRGETEAANDFEVYSQILSHRRAVRRVLDRLTREFREELVDVGAVEGERHAVRLHGLEQFRLDGTLLSEAPLLLLPNNGVGAIQAKINPLWDYREGRHAVDGAQMAAETLHRVQASKYFAALAHPRLEGDMYRRDASGSDEVEILLQEGYGVLQAGDAALQVGRASVIWGPGEHGGLQLTNNARSLDLIKFSTPSPFQLPWVFRHLGSWRVTLFGANLGPQQAPYRYPWLTGWRLSYQPWRYLELGVGNTTMMGGEGAPYLSPLDIFGEFFGFRPAGTSPISPNKTNHIMEASVLVRVPELMGVQFYGMLANEDKRDSIKRFLRDGSSYLTGIYLPRLDSTGVADLRLEFRRMCAIMYRHTLYTNGYTLNDLIIGDDLGSDALGFRAKTNIDLSDTVLFAASFDWELRRSDIHNVTIEPDGTLGDDIVVAEGPHEQRYRFILEPQFEVANGVHLFAAAGYERVLNANYQQGVSRNNWLGAVSLRIDLDRHFRAEAR